MNRKRKRWLVRNLKMGAVCCAMLYLAVGVTKIGESNKITSNAQMLPEVTEVVADTITQTPEPTEEQIVETEPEETYETLVKSRDWSGEESYLLAKIAMAEAEGEDLEGKAHVIMVVLNRVWTKGFPGTIEEVITEEHDGVHQFSVTMDGGRWWRVEPNEECYEAVELVMTGWDKSQGALYFESISDSTWHQKNLEFVFKHGNHYFYKNMEE